MMFSDIDVNESLWLKQHHSVMELLLKDHTTHKNIFWATDSYVHLGEGYCFNDEITIASITGRNEGVIRPRCIKTREEQLQRTKYKAEVFTPSWLCNKQNNLIDKAWFGRENVFNTEIDCDTQHEWIPSEGNVTFPDGKTWLDYIRDTRMEITCGEAPYLASRYDAATGAFIPIHHRIGLLDRKIRIVNENTDSTADWLNNVRLAYQNILGFEWQGDSILLARESLLVTFLEYYNDRFGEMPTQNTVEDIAYIISWNIWQMDGLKMVVPMSCHEVEDPQTSFFDVSPRKTQPCPGCKDNDFLKHNGIYCNVMDWENGHPIKFHTLRNKDIQ